MLSKRLRGSRIAGSPYTVYLIKLLFYLIKLPYGAKRLKENTSPKSDILHATTPKTYHSSSWKNIYMISWQLREAYFWILGNEKKINFLKDKWILGKYKNWRLRKKHPKSPSSGTYQLEYENLEPIHSWIMLPGLHHKKNCSNPIPLYNAWINKNGRSPLQEIFLPLKVHITGCLKIIHHLLWKQIWKLNVQMRITTYVLYVVMLRKHPNIFFLSALNLNKFIIKCLVSIIYTLYLYLYSIYIIYTL